jgi:hypothetical protein
MIKIQISKVLRYLKLVSLFIVNYSSYIFFSKKKLVLTQFAFVI